MNRKKRIQAHKNEKGFTLVEVIAVLVILGILAAVAVPKFFDMQNTARTKAIEGAVGELNGQVALAFAQNALNGNSDGGYMGFTGYIGPDFVVKIPAGGAETSATEITPAEGTIELKDQAGSLVALYFLGSGLTDSPGYFSLTSP